MTATFEEIISAIESLTPAEWRTLRSWAAKLGASSRTDAGDLLQEAFVRTLAGAATGQGRVWFPRRPGHSLRNHLIGAMRSLTSNERESFWHRIRHQSVTAEPDMPEPLTLIPDFTPPPDAMLYACQLGRVAFDVLANDADALTILAGRLDRATESEIQAEAGMTEHRFEAARKRIVRKRSAIRQRLTAPRLIASA